MTKKSKKAQSKVAELVKLIRDYNRYYCVS